MNTELNAFLALLEGRPETFRDLLRRTPRLGGQATGNIQQRIAQAVENIKCQAVKTAVREIYNSVLRLEPPSNLTLNTADAFYEGVQSVEDILGQVLKTCEEAETKLGPAPTSTR